MDLLERINIVRPLTTTSIRKWLEENKSVFHNSIITTECNKWRKWEQNNSLHIFPCIPEACISQLNEECCFIELYLNLQKILTSIKSEKFYQKEVETYQKIEHNEKAVFEWTIKNEKYGKMLIHVNSKIKYYSNKNKKQIKILHIDKEELKQLWLFKSIFEENYYSSKFDNYRK